MRSMTCERCGSSEFAEKDNKLICCFCRAAYEKISAPKGFDTTIDVKSDVDNLLEKCRKDSKNAGRYASLVLDIDPENKEALKYL